MINRINLLLRAKNITSRTFAEEIGVQPSGMSHILSGRNNPSLDFVTKVLRRYPEISTDWLIFGKGEMLRGAVPQTEVQPAPTPSVAAVPKPEAAAPMAADLFTSNAAEPAAPLSGYTYPTEDDFETPEPPCPDPAPAVPRPPHRQVSKIIIFYDDRTFEVYEG